MNFWRAIRLRRVGLRRRLTGFALALISFSMGTAVLLNYYLSKKSLERDLGRELLAIVNSVAPLIDGDALGRIDHNTAGENTSEFNKIRALLVKVRDGNGLKSNGSPLYILRKAEEFPATGNLEFVVMTDRDEHGHFFVGTRYHATAHNLVALAGNSTATGVYQDSLGLWISAAAPIRNSLGKVPLLCRPTGRFNISTSRPVNRYW